MPVPFSGEQFTFYNPDGSEIRVLRWGKPFRSCLRNSRRIYGRQRPGERFLLVRDALIGPRESRPERDAGRCGGPESLGLPQHVRAPRATTRANAELAHDEGGVQRRWEVRRERQRARLEAAADAEEEPELAGTTGDYVGLCMLVQFPDLPGMILQGEVDNFCKLARLTGFGNNGSAYDYFLAVSDGKLRYTNVVTAYYTSQHPRAHYTDPAIPYGTRA